MNDEEIFGSHEIALMQSKQFALQSVLALDLPTTIEVSGLSFEILGSKIERRISIVLDQLRDEHGNNLPYLIAIAVRESWFACCEGAWYSSLMVSVARSWLLRWSRPGHCCSHCRVRESRYRASQQAKSCGAQQASSKCDLS